MDFKLFETKLKVLPANEGSRLRNKYIEKFLDTNQSMYQEQVQKKQKFLDGYCYLGYLWDYIKKPVPIEQTYIEKVATQLEEVYVFWDIHSCERIFIENYWKFAKDAVLKMNIETLLKGEKYLPEDIYIFDKSMKWTLIKTHEDIDGKCYCLKSGVI